MVHKMITIKRIKSIYNNELLENIEDEYDIHSRNQIANFIFYAYSFSFSPILNIL